MPTYDDKRLLIEDAIMQNQITLQNILRGYVMRFGLADIADAKQIADEVFTELVIEALEHADRYDADREAIPWLIGIGLNIIRRRRSATARQNQREIPIRDLYSATEAQQSDGELFDRVGSAMDILQTAESNQNVTDMLSRLSEADAQVIRLAILHDLDSETVAQHLNITPSAARVRLHRALKRLRALLDLERET